MIEIDAPMSLEPSTVSKELALFSELKEGDPAAFKTFCLRYYDKLLVFVLTLVPGNSYLAEETVQEVFTRLWERRETIEIHSSVRYYLYRSCRNILYNLLEKKATRDALSLSRVEPVPEPAEDAAGQLSYKLLETDFREAVHELPEKAQKAFFLRYYNQSQNKEIARSLRSEERGEGKECVGTSI